MINLSNLKYKIIALRYLITEERKYNSDANWIKKIKLLLNGFTSEKYNLYNFEQNNMSKFLSDFQRINTQKINNRYSILLDDKELFELLFRDEKVVPRTYGIVNNNKIIINNTLSNIDELVELLKKEKKLIVKKKSGGGGKGIFRLEQLENRILINNETITEKELIKFIDQLGYSLITEHLEQADYSSMIYPGTINTIRILVMKDPETKSPFIATAVHKFGSKKTEPVDNVWAGGLTSLVDLDTGILKKPALHDKDNKKIKWITRHPDTDIVIEGIEIPNWDKIKQSVLNFTNKIEKIQYVGWDVVVTNEGYKIIEGNNYSDVNILQIHRPLLNNEKIKSFYHYHGII